MPKNYVLSIAGLDPSGGAGLLADIKTFEANDVLGFGVASALTFQTEDKFEGVSWVSFEEIQKQLEPLFKQYQIDVVKVGLIESLEVLNQLLDYLLKKNQEVKIVWDPIFSASAGFDFHTEIDENILNEILEKVFLVTPNNREMELLNVKASGLILLKGGHNENDSNDILKRGEEILKEYSSEKIAASKHGTGCVLSSAIAANLVLGYSIEESCGLAKVYITSFLTSSDTLLGRHEQVEYID